MANTTGLGDTIYAAVRKALEDKNGGSGGGSSDLSIAQVTFTYTHEETGDTKFSLPIAREAITVPFAAPTTSQTAFIDKDFNGETVSVILYKGLCTTFYDGTGTLSASGNATYNDRTNELKITGDCTITVSGSLS